MRTSTVLGLLLIVTVMTPSLLGQQKTRQNRQRNYPPKLEGAKEFVYKTIDDVKLKIYVFEPADHKPTDKRPAIVFFFWRRVECRLARTV